MTEQKNRRRAVTAEEARLWREVMRGAVAYPGRLAPAEPDADGSPPLPPKPLPPPLPSQPPSSSPPPLPRQSQPRLEHGKTPGVDRATADKLRRGEMPIEAVLDLHGLTQDMAHAALSRYIHVSWELGRRCLLLITGKGNREGTGVLRTQVPRWLNEPELRARLLAFSHARPHHGGEGALYLLLKRRR